MAVAYVDVWGTVYTNTSSTPVSKPTGASGGDLLITVIAFHRLTGETVTVTPPSGWTLINSTTVVSGIKYAYLVTYYRICQQGDSSWSWNYSANVDACTVCLAFNGHDQYDPIPVKTSTTDTDGDQYNTATGLTMPRPGMIVAAFGSRDDSPKTNTPPSGMTERFDNSTNRPAYADIMLAVDTQSVGSGSTGNKTSTWSGNVDMSAIQLIGIQEPFFGYHMII